MRNRCLRSENPVDGGGRNDETPLPRISGGTYVDIDGDAARYLECGPYSVQTLREPGHRALEGRRKVTIVLAEDPGK